MGGLWLGIFRVFEPSAWGVEWHWGVQVKFLRGLPQRVGRRLPTGLAEKALSI